MFEWIRDKGIAQSDSGKGGTLWTRGAIGGKSQEPRAKSQEPRAKSQEPRAKSQEPRANSVIPYDDIQKKLDILGNIAIIYTMPSKAYRPRRFPRDSRPNGARWKQWQQNTKPKAIKLMNKHCN
jgi:hypothetical protein